MFTEKSLRALKPRERPYRVYEKGSDPGFGVQVTPAGTIAFFLAYRLHGARRFHGLGRYPAIGLADARIAAREARAALEAGDAPKAKRAHRQATVKALFDGYVASRQAAGKRSYKKIEQTLATALPVLKENTPARAIKPGDIVDTLRPIIERDARVQASRLRAYLHAAFAWGIASENNPWGESDAPAFGLTDNPVAYVPADPTGARAGDRVLSWEEIKTAWTHPTLALVYRLAIRLLLITGQRPTEVLHAPWSEFDGDVWLLPAARAKNNRDHLIPLPQLALDTLDELRVIFPDAIWLFPARFNADAEKPLGKDSLVHALARADIDWRPRDLRRTWKTLAGEIGISKFDRDRVQNHVIGDVSGKHYDRYSYMTEKRAALDQWAAALAARINPPSPPQSAD